MNTRRKLAALLAIATLISIVNASVFVYYPISLTIQPQEPPVVFQEGSNANEKDLGGQTILVSIGSGGTSLYITVHPTLQRNYYYDIAKIVNNDGKTYYVKFRVTKPIDDTRVTTAYLIVNTSNNEYYIDLMSTNLQPQNWIVLEASGELRVDLYLVLSGHSGGSISVSVDLIITTTNTAETPPQPPS